MKVDAQRLRERGWNDEEIGHAKRIVGNAKRHKHPHLSLLKEATFWAVVVLMGASTLAAAYLVAPLFLFATGVVLYPFLIVLGVGLGSLFDHVINDLDQLEPKHHVIISSFVPLIGVIGFVTILGRIGSVGSLGHEPVVSSAVFLVSFLGPYVYRRWRR